MPIDPTQKPTETYMKKTEERLQLVWRDAFNSMDKAYQFYLRQYPIWPEEPRFAKRPVFRSGRATSIVDHAVDATLAFEPRWRRKPSSETPEALAKASDIENGLSDVFNDAMLQNPYYAPKVNGKQLAITNYTQLFVGLDSDALTRPVKKRGENEEDFDRREWEWSSNRHAWNPIRIEVPPHGEVLMEPSEKSPIMAIRRRKMFAFELEALVASKLKKKGVYGREYKNRGDPYDEIEVLEQWTAHWVALSWKNEFLVEPNSWGFQPYLHTFGGTAVIPIIRNTLPTEIGVGPFNPKYYVEQALLFPVMDDIVLLDQMVVSQHALLAAAAWARKGYTGDTSEAAEQLENDILQGAPNEWWIEAVPQLPGQVFSHEAVLKQDIEESTFSLLESGFAQSNMDTATHVIILSEKVHRRFQTSVIMVDHLYSLAGSNVLKLIHRLKEVEGIETIDMGEHSLKASDVEKRFHIAADFGQVDTVTYLQQKQDARQELQMKIIDEETYFSIARYEDVAGIRRRRMKDRVRQLPEVDAILQEAALREMGLGQVADRLEAEAETRKGSMVDSVGAPLFPPDQAAASKTPARPTTPTPSNGQVSY